MAKSATQTKAAKSAKRQTKSPRKNKAGKTPGWSKWAAFVVVAIALFFLYKTLSGYSPEDLLTSVSQVPLGRIIFAIGFAAASYASLTLFDYLALHYAGRPLAYPKAALASFVSLSLGHNIGLAAFSSGAIRYRFYTRWGASTEEVAKVILFCGVTVALGLLLLTGMALIANAESANELTGIGKTALLALGIASLGLVCLYLLLSAFVRGTLKIRKWEFQLPSLKLAIAQVIVGVVNFSLVAACLHQTLLAMAELSYFKVASAFVIANSAAILTHVPGGLGVIEWVIVTLFANSELIGAVLAFRFVYYLLPLIVGGSTFAATELYFKANGGKEKVSIA